MMIKEISAKCLKGLDDFTQALGQRTLIIGPNGSGKSARSIALHLLRLGYMPGSKKQPKAILDDLATGDKLIISGTLQDNTRLLRRFRRADSSCLQDYTINHRKAAMAKFNEAVLKSPKIVDLSAFTDLSDAKKIEFLLELFPADGNIQEVDAKIMKLRDEKNVLNDRIKKKEDLAASLLKTHSEMQLPVGTLAEIQQEITRVDAERKLTSENLYRARRDLAEKQAQETKAKQETEQPAVSASNDVGKTEKTIPNTPTHTHKLDQKLQGAGIGSASLGFGGGGAYQWKQSPSNNLSTPAASIQKIIDAMDKVCKTCGAKIIAKMELNKYLNEEKF